MNAYGIDYLNKASQSLADSHGWSGDKTAIAIARLQDCLSNILDYLESNHEEGL